MAAEATASDLITVFGVPAHPLLVHIPVVLLPLTALGVVVAAFRPVVLRRYGWLIALCAVVAALGTVAATITGQQLVESMGSPAALDDHRYWGLVTRLLSLLLAVAAVALWRLLGRPSPSDSASADGQTPASWRAWVSGLLRATSGVLAMLTLAAVVWTGHLGAESVWGSSVAVRGEPRAVPADGSPDKSIT